MKETESEFVTTAPLPGGMNAYNQKTKRFVRWRKGYDQPAPATDLVLVPSFLFLNKKYIYWNELGYYEMGLKDSSDFRARSKVSARLKRARSEVIQTKDACHHKAPERPAKKNSPAVLPSSPFCPWVIDRDARGFDQLANEDLSDDDQGAGKSFPPVQNNADTSHYMPQWSRGPVSARSPSHFSQGPSSPQSLSPLESQQQPRCGFSPTAFPMQLAPYATVYSYSTQTVTHSMSVAQPPPPTTTKPQPQPAPQPAPQAELAEPEPAPVESMQIALVEPEEKEVPWYVAHTPATQRSFAKGDHVRVTAGTYSGCNGRVTGLAKAGSKVLQGQLKVRVMQTEGEDCTVFIPVASLQPRGGEKTLSTIAEAHPEPLPEPQSSTHIWFEDDDAAQPDVAAPAPSSGSAVDTAIDLCNDD